MAQKDLNRQQNKQTKTQSNLIDIFSKITVEDIFKFIGESFFKLKDQKDLIKNAFKKAGYKKQDEQDNLAMEIEALRISEVPFDDDLVEGEEEEGTEEIQTEKQIPEEEEEEVY